MYVLTPLATDSVLRFDMKTWARHLRKDTLFLAMLDLSDGENCVTTTVTVSPTYIFCTVWKRRRPEDLIHF